MGLFNSGKNDKVEKVNKYERHYNVPEKSSHRRSSKVRQHGNEHRAMSQPPPTFNNVVPSSFYPGQNSFMNPAAMLNAMPPNYYSGQMRFPMAPYDLSKYPFASQPVVAQQIPPNFWNQQQQQPAQWPMMFPQPNYPFMPSQQF